MIGKIEDLIEKLAEQYPNSEHEMTVECFAYWLQKNAAPVVERQPVDKSKRDTASNPVLGYADSYRQMARTGTTSIDVWSIITDLERNIAPLFTSPPAPVADEMVRLLTRARIYARGEFRDEIDACLKELNQ